MRSITDCTILNQI